MKIITDCSKTQCLNDTIEKLKRILQIHACFPAMFFIKFRINKGKQQKCILKPCFVNDYFVYYKFESFHFVIAKTKYTQTLIFACDDKDFSASSEWEFYFSEKRHRFIINTLENDTSKGYFEIEKFDSTVSIKSFKYPYRGLFNKPELLSQKEIWHNEHVPKWKIKTVPS